MVGDSCWVLDGDEMLCWVIVVECWLVMKSHGANDMQRRIGRRTSSCNISRILWNLRLEQDNVILSSFLLIVQFFNIHTRSLSDKKIATLPGVKLSKQRGYSFINLTHNRFEVNQRRYFLSISLLKLLSIVFLDFFKKLYQSFQSLLALLF